MRQLAWLNAVPQTAQTTTHGRKAPPANTLSRLKKMQAQGAAPSMPPLRPALQPLLAHLQDVGPVLSGGMGPAPLTYGELQAWQASTGVELSPWQATLLRRLSREFVAETNAAADPARPAPWAPEHETEERRAAVARDLGIGLRAIAQAQRGRRGAAC